MNNVAVESVGPSWGGQITHKALVALIVFFILIALYISIFFEWRMALAAIVAVLHDIAVTVGIYSHLWIRGDPGHRRRVPHDPRLLPLRHDRRVRPCPRQYQASFGPGPSHLLRRRQPVDEPDARRSINTSLVAIMPILAMLVLGAEILGAKTLQYFGLALLVGLDDRGVLVDLHRLTARRRS